MKVFAMQNDTVDTICMRYYGRTDGVTEQVIKSNPGLADQGPILPHGYPVDMPDVVQTTTVQTLQLWD